jgi:hypothetical protein
MFRKLTYLNRNSDVCIGIPIHVVVTQCCCVRSCLIVMKLPIQGKRFDSLWLWRLRLLCPSILYHNWESIDDELQSTSRQSHMQNGFSLWIRAIRGVDWRKKLRDENFVTLSL